MNLKIIKCVDQYKVKFLCIELDFIYILNFKSLSLKSQVNCVAFSADMEIMITGSDDNSVRVFNAYSGELVVKVDGHEGNSVVFENTS